MFQEAVTGARKKLGLSNPRTQWYIINQADLYGKQGRLHLAEPQLRELAAFLRDQAGPATPAHVRQRDIWNTSLTPFVTQSLLGGALLGQKKYADAEPLLVQGYEGMKALEAKMPPKARYRLTEALERLVQLYDAWDKQAEAARWRKELEIDKARPRP